MKIELRNIEYFPALSEETIAFSAALYIDQVHAGEAKNRGNGEATGYWAANQAGHELIVKAEQYCSQLPPIRYDIPEYSDSFTVDMSLEHMIDRFVEDYLQEKENEKFRDALETAMTDSVVVGIPDQSFRKLNFQRTLDDLLHSSEGNIWLADAIRNTVIPQLWDQEKILNRNIPYTILRSAGVSPEQCAVDLNGLEKASAEESRRRGR